MPTGIYKRTRPGWNKGKKLSKETRIKLSQNNARFWLGKKHPFGKGGAPWNKGRKMTKEEIEKMSKSLKGRVVWNKGKKCPKLSGSKHPNWRGGDIKIISKHQRIEKLLGKAKIKICEICGKFAEDWSNKDHKYSLNLADWQALCKKCHNAFDYKFNNKRIRGKTYKERMQICLSKNTTLKTSG